MKVLISFRKAKMVAGLVSVTYDGTRNLNETLVEVKSDSELAAACKIAQGDLKGLHYMFIKAMDRKYRGFDKNEDNKSRVVEL